MSRPSRIAITSASFTMSWMLAPVAYGVMVASLSRSAGVSSVFDLGQVVLVRRLAALLRGVAHLVDAVDPAGTEHGLVERLRHVGREDVQDPVLGRRLRLHAEQPSHVPVDEPARLLQPRHLGQERLERAHSAAAAHTAHDIGVLRGTHLGADQRVAGRGGQIGQTVAARIQGRTALRARCSSRRPGRPSDPRLPSESASSKKTITPP